MLRYVDAMKNRSSPVPSGRRQFRLECDVRADGAQPKRKRLVQVGIVLLPRLDYAPVPQREFDGDAGGPEQARLLNSQPVDLCLGAPAEPAFLGGVFILPGHGIARGRGGMGVF